MMDLARMMVDVVEYPGIFISVCIFFLARFLLPEPKESDPQWYVGVGGIFFWFAVVIALIVVRNKTNDSSSIVVNMIFGFFFINFLTELMTSSPQWSMVVIHSLFEIGVFLFLVSWLLSRRSARNKTIDET